MLTKMLLRKLSSNKNWVVLKSLESDIQKFLFPETFHIVIWGFFWCYAETEQGVAQAIIRSKLDFRRDPWPKVSDNAKDLVKRMLNPDPKQRLSAQEVLGTIQDFTHYCLKLASNFGIKGFVVNVVIVLFSKTCARILMSNMVVLI